MSELSRRLALQTGISAAFGAAFCSRALAQNSMAAEDALSIMSADPKFSDWVQILRYTGLAQYAAGDEKFTAFIPTNNAFQKYPEVLNAVLRSRSRAFPDTTTQVEFVRSHVILDIHPLSETNGAPTTLTSIAGNPITISEPQSGIYDVSWVSINQWTATTRIATAPIVASNAIIYAFNDVTLVQS